jgi:tetratricopeptide (TPR) repeat protein
MPENDATGLRSFVDWMLAGRERAEPLLREFLTIPPASRDDWLGANPDACSVQFFEGVLDSAENDAAENDAAQSLALTRFVLRHLDSIDTPPGTELALILLHGHTWRVHAGALQKAGDADEALRAYEMASAIFQTEPVAREELLEVEKDAALLRDSGGSAGIATRLLAETPYAEWTALAERAELQHPGALAELSRETIGRVYRVPLESLAIADLGVKIADALPVGMLPAAAQAQLRGRAWRDLGVALRHVARYEEALSAYGRAEEILEGYPGLVPDRATVQFARAATLQEVNRFEESKADLARCKPVFEMYGDRRRLLLCGIQEGALLHRTGRYRDAISVYLPLLDPAQAMGDLDALASIHNNIVHSAIELAEYALAEEHLEEAVALFTTLEAPVHAARSELARGRMLVRKGEVERGIAHLHEVRDQFLRRRIVEEAGLAGLDIVEAHLSLGAGSEAEALAREIIREFTAARLNARAITALRYLSEAIAARKASTVTVDNVREFIRTLRTRPDTEFAATA